MCGLGPRHRGSEDTQGGRTSKYIFGKWEVARLKMDLYLGLLLCGTHYTFGLLFLRNILQYATVIFLYVIMILLCVV